MHEYRPRFGTEGDTEPLSFESREPQEPEKQLEAESKAEKKKEALLILVWLWLKRLVRRIMEIVVGLFHLGKRES